ncbi:MAG: acyltransferase family protein [Deltaproteobacteria bacterium]|nr:MAG: acyltransferase family protein [Deltaproteobacteria bacterium]
MHDEVRETIELLLEREQSEGYDPFGFRPKILEQVLPVAHFLYRHWFRVEPHGLENVPDGRLLLIANHSGQLPFDGMMIGTALVLDRRPPRVVRGMVERWVPTLPFVSQFFARAGQVVGTPANARALLEREELLMVFPEGARGISKTFDRRYQLEEFGLGFMRLALETNTPIVPIGVVGAEEQLPSFYNAKGLARLFGMPSVPVSPTLVLPLPVKYRIYFGEPLHFEGDPDDEDRVIRERVDTVTAAIRALLDRGLRERTGIFS